jgi:DNA-binding NtrC family response regulator
MVSARPKRVLVVDDDPDTRGLLQRVIGGMGYKVVTADCRESALQASTGQRVDLAIVDMYLAGESGLEILKTWKENGAVQKYVAVTAYGNIALAEDCRRLGVKGFVEKPFDLEYVRLLIKGLLEEAASGTAGEKEEVP